MMLSLLAMSMMAGCGTAANRSGKVASCADRGPITFAEFKMLEDGQTREQVNAIFGCRGVLRLGIVGNGPYTVEWTGGAGGSTSVLVIFIDDRLSSEGVQKYGF